MSFICENKSTFRLAVFAVFVTVASGKCNLNLKICLHSSWTHYSRRNMSKRVKLAASSFSSLPSKAVFSALCPDAENAVLSFCSLNDIAELYLVSHSASALVGSFLHGLRRIELVGVHHISSVCACALAAQHCRSLQVIELASGIILNSDVSKLFPRNLTKTLRVLFMNNRTTLRAFIGPHRSAAQSFWTDDCTQALMECKNIERMAIILKSSAFHPKMRWSTIVAKGARRVHQGSAEHYGTTL